MAGNENLDGEEKYNYAPCDACSDYDLVFMSKRANRVCEKYAHEPESYKEQYRPGYLCKSCCKAEFLEDAQGCFEVCQDENAIPENLEETFEQVFNLKGMTKTDFNGAEVYINSDNTFVLGKSLSLPKNKFRPMKIDGYFTDELEKILYIKLGCDLHGYDLKTYEEIQNRLDPASSNIWPQMLATEDGLLFLTWSSENSFGAIMSPRTSDLENPQRVGESVMAAYSEKITESGKFFGVTYRKESYLNHKDMDDRLKDLSENQLINEVAVPLLRKLGFRNVERVSHHGPGEAGIDIGPFYKENPLGYLEWYGAQTKAQKLTAGGNGNVNNIINQLEDAFRTPRNYMGQEIMIHTMYLICSKDITNDAEIQLDIAIKGFEKKGHVVRKIKRHRLLEMMLDSDFSLQ